ncbi:hypothetical protein BDY24DRAFT_417614 [Mrakia frigida]|uniref:uncharacterized protein n=1 Tax=Mrakia frigida TaxID=29902 RepID=UPI003FCC24AB
MVLKVAEHSPICKHLVLDCANPITEPQAFLLDKLAALTGAKGWVNVEPKNDFERAMISSNTLRPGLARALVGWEARKASFTDGLDVYYASWKAGRK